MARRSTKEKKNIYQLTREALDLTREEASEILVTLAPERIEKIENERSLPHPDEVLLMSDTYKQPNLCNYYCANQCPIGGTVCSGSESKRAVPDRFGNAGIFKFCTEKERTFDRDHS